MEIYYGVVSRIQTSEYYKWQGRNPEFHHYSSQYWRQNTIRKEKFLDKIYGKLYADKGYIGKDLIQLLFADGLHLITHIKNNMKNSLMTMSDKILLRKRSIIETVHDELKNSCQIEHSRHRSFTNFLSNIVAGLLAYSFLPKKPSIKYQKVASNQLSFYESNSG